MATPTAEEHAVAGEGTQPEHETGATGTDAGTNAPSGQDGTGSVDPQDSPGDERTFTQSELNAILARERKRSEETVEQRLREAEQEANQRAERERMDELERLKLEKTAAQQEKAQLSAELEQQQLATQRIEFLATHATDLPDAYRALVTGDTPEALQESLDDARTRFEGDRERFFQPPHSEPQPARSVSTPSNAAGADKPDESDGALTPYQRIMAAKRARQ